jgi:hypothetical protein
MTGHGQRVALDVRNRTTALEKTTPRSGPKRDANVITDGPNQRLETDLRTRSLRSLVSSVQP